MSLLTPEGEAEPVTGAISRRRVLIGTAWATPVVLLAVATPPAAASTVPQALVPTVPGAIGMGTPTASQDTSVLTVSTTVAYSGTASTATVTDLYLRVSVPSGRGTGDAPSVSSGWLFQGPVATSGGNKVYTFKWIGGPLSFNGAAPFTATIPKTTDRTAFTVSVSGEAKSLEQTLTVGPSSATVGAYSLLSYNWGPQAAVGAAGSSPRYATFSGAIINLSGWPNDNTAPITDLQATVTVLNGATAPGAGTVLGGPWTYLDATVGATSTVYRFKLNAGTLTPSYNATDFSFRVPRKVSDSAKADFVIAFSGHSPTAAAPLTTLTSTVNI